MAKEYSVAEIVKNPIQLLFLVFVGVTMVAGVAFVVDGYYLRQD